MVGPRYDRSVSECRIWPGAKNNSGYGVRKIGGRKGKLKLVHRLAWEEAHGPIPDGMCVMHVCDVPACFEVSHLRLGTHSENMKDMWDKGRAGPRHKVGERHANARFSDAQVQEIRDRWAAGGVTQRALAKEYGMNHLHLNAIINGRARATVA